MPITRRPSLQRSDLDRKPGDGAVVAGVKGAGRGLYNAVTGFASLSTPPQSTTEKVVNLLGPGALPFKRLFVDPQVAEYQAAKSEANQGHTSESMGHSLAAAIPVFGPIASHLGQTAGSGDIAGAAGEGVVYFGAPKVLGKLFGETSAVPEEVPAPKTGPRLFLDNTDRVAKQPAADIFDYADKPFLKNQKVAPKNSPMGLRSRFETIPGGLRRPAEYENVIYSDSAAHMARLRETMKSPGSTPPESFDPSQAPPPPRGRFFLGPERQVGSNIEHNILSPQGKPVGLVNSNVNDGMAKLNWLGSTDEQGGFANDLSKQIGLRGIRQLQNDFLDKHPDVQSIGGVRTGGLRGNETRQVSVPRKPAPKSDPKGSFIENTIGLVDRLFDE